MRVVAGRFGGRRLSAPRGRATRPTSERVREALFSMLGEVEGARALDLYAGSGALGIEALSRGASVATFVDSGAGAVAAVRANLERLGIERRGPGAEARVVRSGAEAFLRSAERRGERFDLVLCDPPYNLAARRREALGRLLTGVLAPGARTVSESSPAKPLRLDLPVQVERRYGDTLIVVQRAPEGDA